MPARNRRPKISTTIAPENCAFLKSLIRQGKAATEAYFASLSPEALDDENRLGEALAHETGQLNFDE